MSGLVLGGSGILVDGSALRKTGCIPRSRCNKQTHPTGRPEIDRLWDLGGSYHKIPKAIVYLLHGDSHPKLRLQGGTLKNCVLIPNPSQGLLSEPAFSRASQIPTLHEQTCKQAKIAPVSMDSRLSNPHFF